MKNHIVLITFFFISFFSFSQTVIRLDEVYKHIGDSVTVCGKVSGGRFLEQAKGTPTFLNLGSTWKMYLFCGFVLSNIQQ